MYVECSSAEKSCCCYIIGNNYTMCNAHAFVVIQSAKQLQTSDKRLLPHKACENAVQQVCLNLLYTSL